MRTFQDFITEARKKVKIEVNPQKPIEYKIADIGPGKKEYNVKTSKGWTSEAYDASVMSSSQIRKTGEGGRIGAQRKKSAPERRRVRAIGGGKTEPVEYKDRKDIGTQRQVSARVQQPTQERGSAREAQLAAAKEERRKAARARAAAKKGGGEAPASAAKPKAKDVAKTASKLLSTKKPQAEPAAGYTPPKASGLSTQERKALYKKGERKLRDLVLQSTGKTSEKQLKHKYTSK
jgi:hypothetical protein